MLAKEELPDSVTEPFRELFRLHESEVERFTSDQSPIGVDWKTAWLELVYCILAGTQVRSESATVAVNALIGDLGGCIAFSVIARSPDRYTSRMTRVLRSAGYRFPYSKSCAIVSAAAYFPHLMHEWGSPREMNVSDARSEMVDHIRGVGIKTASLWLRNIGHDLPVVDVHVRRVLACSRSGYLNHTGNSISDREYETTERLILQISSKAGVPSGKLDYAIWVHGKHRCSEGMCDACPFQGGRSN
jgi:thermostable 8-oxoguanine DNA glycosylase